MARGCGARCPHPPPHRARPPHRGGADAGAADASARRTPLTFPSRGERRLPFRPGCLAPQAHPLLQAKGSCLQGGRLARLAGSRASGRRGVDSTRYAGGGAAEAGAARGCGARCLGALRAPSPSLAPCPPPKEENAQKGGVSKPRIALDASPLSTREFKGDASRGASFSPFLVVFLKILRILGTNLRILGTYLRILGTY